MEYLIQEKGVTQKILLPPYEHPHFIQYADTSSHEGDFGRIMVQRVPGNYFSLTQHIFHIKAPVDVMVRSSKPKITLGYFLQGSPPGTIEGLGKTGFAESHCHLNYIPPGTHYAHLEPNEYAILQVCLSPAILKDLAGKYPVIREVWNGAVKNLPQGMQQSCCAISPRMRDVLHRIMHCEMEEPLRGVQLQAYVLELLLLYIIGLPGGQQEVSSNYQFRQDDLRIIDTIVEEQRTNPDEMLHYTALAKQMHMHPRKMLNGLALKYGFNLLSLKIQTRITHACALLLDTEKSVKDIAYEVGYKDVSAFIRAFKKNVGQTPGDYRGKKPGG